MQVLDLGGEMIGTTALLCISCFLVVLYHAGLWMVLANAGRPGWMSLVPVYNMVELAKVCDKPGWWGVMILVPVANIVFWILLMTSLAERLSKGVGFALGLVALPWIFMPVLGLSKAKPVSEDFLDQTEETGEVPEIETDDDSPHFGRIRWWFEESPVAFLSSVLTLLLILGIAWMLLSGIPQPQDNYATGVTLQEVLTSTDSSGMESDGDDATTVESVAGSETDRDDLENVEVPEIEPNDADIEMDKVLGNQPADQQERAAVSQTLSKAGDLLEQLLKAKSTGRGDEPGQGTDRGFGTLDPNSTSGRQARWVITYPTVNQGEYEKMLDSFGIELAFLLTDRATLQYASNLAGAGKRRQEPVDGEDRMWWQWESENRLRALDIAILRKLGMTPSSEVIQLYPKSMEQKLAEREKQFLRGRFRTTDVERILQTDFRIFADAPGVWVIKVTNVRLK